MLAHWVGAPCAMQRVRDDKIGQHPLSLRNFLFQNCHLLKLVYSVERKWFLLCLSLFLVAWTAVGTGAIGGKEIYLLVDKRWMGLYFDFGA